MPFAMVEIAPEQSRRIAQPLQREFERHGGRELVVRVSFRVAELLRDDAARIFLDEGRAL